MKPDVLQTNLRFCYDNLAERPAEPGGEQSKSRSDTRQATDSLTQWHIKHRRVADSSLFLA
jgi:hypothetical protein